MRCVHDAHATMMSLLLGVNPESIALITEALLEAARDGPPGRPHV